MEFLRSLFLNTLSQVWQTFSVNWPFLAAGAVITALMKIYVNQEAVAAFLRHHQGKGVFTATMAAVGSPLCSCGTIAVILGMMAGRMPWAPIVAFMVASPLTSPQELVYSAGLFGWTFALTFFGASIALGLAGGLAAYILENRGWLADQARFKPIPGSSELAATADNRVTHVVVEKPTSPCPAWHDFLKEVYLRGRQLLAFFLMFAFIGYLLNGLIPQTWIPSLFGRGHVYGVPLAATMGLPFYLNTEASLPLVRTFLEAGMSPGAVMAFLITGAGTSIGAVTGALTIARWRVVGLVLATLWVGAVVFGFTYNAVQAAGVFQWQP